MRQVGVRRLAACAVLVATMGGCGSSISALHVGGAAVTSSSTSVPPTQDCGIAGPEPHSPTTTWPTGTVATCTPVSDTVPSTTAPTTTTSPSTTAPTVRPGCASGPTLTLTPSSGPVGTHGTETARCFPSDITLTFEVPEGGGVGFLTAPTDSSGTATMPFAYNSPNGLVGSTTYVLVVSISPNADVDHACTPTTCASATFYER